MTPILHFDVETFSECDLSEAGVYRYAEHPSTEVTMLGYAVDDGPATVWIPSDDVPPDIIAAVKARQPSARILAQKAVPQDFKERWSDPATDKRAHNAQFERVVLAGVAGKKLGLEPRPIAEWTCTAAKVAASGLPRALGDAGKALGTHPKDEAARPIMLQLSKPRKPTKADPSTRWTMQNAPEKWIATLCYNVDDVLAERDLDNAIPDLDENEQRLYHLDQKINERGWAVDLEAVHNILFVVEQYKEALAIECRELTEDWMGNGLEPTQREKISDWVRANGYTGLRDMQAETIKWIVTQENVPSIVKRVLRIYSTYNAKSVSKLQAMLNAVCADGRLRGMFMFYGAATGRWSSLIVQLQNMMRPVIKDPSTAIEAFAARDLSLIRFLWPDVDPMKVAGSCIRGCLVAGKNSDLICPGLLGDRGSGQPLVLRRREDARCYRDYDAGKGRHPYSITVCNAFGLDLQTFSDEDPRRQWGKVMRLALGYEGGVSALLRRWWRRMESTLTKWLAAVLPLLPTTRSSMLPGCARTIRTATSTATSRRRATG